MADLDRYKSLITRQKKRVAYARSLVPLLEQAAWELNAAAGDSSSYNALARWLTANGVKPSADARKGARFAPQTLKDYLFMDGAEPTDDAIREGDPNLTDDNKTGRKHRIREQGFRITATREFLKCEPTFRVKWGEARAHRERELLDRHLEEVVAVAQTLRNKVGL